MSTVYYTDFLWYIRYSHHIYSRDAYQDKVGRYTHTLYKNWILVCKPSSRRPVPHVSWCIPCSVSCHASPIGEPLKFLGWPTPKLWCIKMFKKSPRASARKFLAKIFVRPYCEAKKTGKKTCASLLRCKKTPKKSLVRPYCEAFVRPYCQTPLYEEIRNRVWQVKKKTTEK